MRNIFLEHPEKCRYTATCSHKLLFANCLCCSGCFFRSATVATKSADKPLYRNDLPMNVAAVALQKKASATLQHIIAEHIMNICSGVAANLRGPEKCFFPKDNMSRKHSVITFPTKRNPRHISEILKRMLGALKPHRIAQEPQTLVTRRPMPPDALAALRDGKKGTLASLSQTQLRQSTNEAKTNRV